MTPTDDQYAQWRAIAEAAADAPWSGGVGGFVETWDSDGDYDTIADTYGRSQNAEFIATARNEWTTLLDALAAERARADRAEANVEAVEALAAEWEGTVYKLPPGYPMTVNTFCHYWFTEPLRAALATGDGS